MKSLSSITVTAPSRLHFGLLSFGHPNGRQFGGAGMMLEEPATQVVISGAEQLEVTGRHSERVAQIVESWWATSPQPRPLRCRIAVLSAPPLHVGLGVGTQLALAIGTALNAWCRVPGESPRDLAVRLGRGKRSAIGTYGFAHGGLIAELGKLPEEPLAPLLEHLAVPEAWRVVLICPRHASLGLCGSAEQRAFERVPPVPKQITQRLQAELCERLLPAARASRFEDFSRSLYEFGHLAGSCFEAVQGGAYNGAHLRWLVEQVRALGIQGVAQSSWGPTLFAFCADEARACELRRELLRRSCAAADEITVARPDNAGARVERLPASDDSP